MQKRRDFSLDFVRAISILFIIFFHYNCATIRFVSDSLKMFERYNYSGTLGVSLFFILSGASLALSTKNRYSIASFYKKRYMAIFPLFWATYLFVLVTKVVVFQSNLFAGRNPFSFLLTIIGLDGFLLYKIPNYYILGEWFLGCIIVIYFLFPAIRHLFNKNQYALLAGSLLLCVLLERYYAFDMLLPRVPFFRLFEFVFGMFFMTVLNTDSRRWNFVLLTVSIIAGGSVFLVKWPLGVHLTNNFLGIFSFLILVTLAKLFGHHIPEKPFQFISKYSYTAFLLHHVMLNEIVRHSKELLLQPYWNYLLFLLALSLVFVISVAIYNMLIYLLRNPISL